MKYAIMNYKPEDVDTLVKAVEKFIRLIPSDNTELEIAVKPFRKEKPARVGMMKIGFNETAYTMEAVELTDPIRLRLGPTAGVDKAKLRIIVIDNVTYHEQIEAIMQLIADAQPEIEGEV